MSLKNQAIKGFFWNSIERFSAQGIQFVLTIFIARILSPDDYGLIAMLSIFMAVAQVLVDSGFGNALIQKKERSEVDYSTAFYFNIIVSIIIYLLLYFTSPLIANFYEQSQLTQIARVFGFVLIINSFSIVQQARLTILLDFKKQAVASLISVVVSGIVGIYIAYCGYGVWALVWQAIFAAFCRGVIFWIYAHWFPGYVFSMRSFHYMFSFGSRLMLASLLHTVYTNMYSLVVGKVFTASTLGYFNRAFTLGQFPVQNFSVIILKVLYPIQCRFQDDLEKFNYIFVNYLRFSCFVLFPIMIGMFVLAEPLISVLLTDKWLPAVPFLQIICLAGMWNPVMQINVSVLDAKGRSDYHLQSEIIKKILAFVILFVSLPLGIKMICVGLVVYAFTDMAIIIWYTRRLTGIGYCRQIKILLPVILLSTTMGSVAWLASSLFTDAWLRLLVGITVGGIWYLGGAWIFHFKEWEYGKKIICNSSLE
nr:lipopolysaccharide biosynthesis protein [uncultured Bacteroides sp.]